MVTVADREHLALSQPPADLTGFPTHDAGTGVWFRAHTRAYGPWWFASNGQGRFDLTYPHGTCYLGSSIQVAVRERLGETLAHAQMVSAFEAERMVVSRLEVEATVADTTSQQSTSFGITRKIGTTTPYTLPRQWAAALHCAGYGGICYWPRFTVGENAKAVAVFGNAGADDNAPTDRSPMNGAHAAALAQIRVVGLPRRVPTVQPPHE